MFAAPRPPRYASTATWSVTVGFRPRAPPPAVSGASVRSRAVRLCNHGTTTPKVSQSKTPRWPPKSTREMSWDTRPRAAPTAGAYPDEPVMSWTCPTSVAYPGKSEAPVGSVKSMPSCSRPSEPSAIRPKRESHPVKVGCACRRKRPRGTSVSSRIWAAASPPRSVTESRAVARLRRIRRGGERGPVGPYGRAACGGARSLDRPHNIRVYGISRNSVPGLRDH